MRPIATLPPEAQWLLRLARRWACGTAEEASTVEPWPDGWQRLVTLAQCHGLHPLLYREALSTRRTDLPAEARAHIQSRWTLAVAQSLWQQEALRQCVTALQREDIRVIPIKGWVLGHLLYGDPALRPSVDVDLLVPRAQWLQAANVLAGLGYRHANAPWPRRIVERHYKSGEFVHAPVCIELHWHLLPPRPVIVDPAFLWQRAVTRRLDGLDVLTLSWEDQLLTLAGHLGTCLRALQLKHVADIARLLARNEQSFDCDYVWPQARRLHVERLLLYVLFLTHRVFETPLPAEAVQRLAAGGWRVVLWRRYVGWECCQDVAEARGNGRQRQSATLLWKCALADTGWDVARAAAKHAWWRWDERRLGPYRPTGAALTALLRQHAAGEERQTNEVASPEPQRVA